VYKTVTLENIVRLFGGKIKRNKKINCGLGHRKPICYLTGWLVYIVHYAFLEVTHKVANAIQMLTLVF
jgi:hypothetical protein